MGLCGCSLIVSCAQTGTRLCAVCHCVGACVCCAVVALRITPCGMATACKGSPQARQFPHLKFDCEVLQELASDVDAPDCKGCIPRYFYLSELTGICYSEHVPSVPIATFFEQAGVSRAEPGSFKTAKRLFVQGLSTLGVLARHEVKHRDLTFRNMLVRVPDGHSAGMREFSLVLIDFGGAKMGAAQAPGVKPAFLGNRGRSDLYALACAFYSFFYPDSPTNCHSNLAMRMRASESPRAFDSFLAYILHRELADTAHHGQSTLSLGDLIQQCTETVRHW